jgi:hypothetical protein
MYGIVHPFHGVVFISAGTICTKFSYDEVFKKSINFDLSFVSRLTGYVELKSKLNSANNM